MKSHLEHFSAMQSASRPWVIAHRGVLREAPENTLCSFEAAIRQGADAIELDVHQSADGHLVVIHDDTVARTTDGQGAVGELTLGELQALDAGSWMGPAFAGQRIPTLAEVLVLTRGQARLVIEVKGGHSRYPGIEGALVRLLAQTQRVQDVIVISGDAAPVAAIRELDDRVATLCFLDDLCSLGQSSTMDNASTHRFTRYIFGWPEDLTSTLVKQAHRGGTGILSSLLGRSEIDPAVVQHLVAAGVDGIFTDEVAILRSLVDCCLTSS